MQISSITGAYGLSFLILMVNSTLAAGILSFFPRLVHSRHPEYQPLGRSTAIFTMLATAGWVGLVLLHGQVALSKPLSEKKLRLSVLQGNIGQNIKWKSKHANFIINAGDATAADIEALIEAVAARVKQDCGVELQTEVRIVGERLK